MHITYIYNIRIDHSEFVNICINLSHAQHAEQKYSAPVLITMNHQQIGDFQ